MAKSVQLGEDLKKANLIVLTIGGNDFTPIFNDILNDVDISASALQTRLDTILDSYYPSLEASLRTILKLNRRLRSFLPTSTCLHLSLQRLIRPLRKNNTLCCYKALIS